MDRLGQLRGEAGGSQDSTLDTTSPPSESFMTANDTSSKYFSLSEESEIDSTFDISPIKDVSLASTAESEPTITNTDELVNLSPVGNKSDNLDSYKIGKEIEAEKILSGGVDIFDDNENSYDGDELVIDDNVELEEKSDDMKMIEDNNISESTLVDPDTEVANKDTEVVLQIDGKNVDAIDIGNGLYLYRKQGQEELAAVQIVDGDQQQPSFKFLKVRENAEGNLEVYEEIEIEVPKEVPTKEGKPEKNPTLLPIKDIGKVIIDSTCNKGAEKVYKTPSKEITTTATESDSVKDTAEKPEVNFNGKMKKINEARKSPVIGSFTPMTFHSTPNKEGIPLTKTMVDQQLHPSRHSDNVKKTIEVHTDHSKQKTIETNVKCKDFFEDAKEVEPVVIEKDIESIEKNKVIPEMEHDNVTEKEHDVPETELDVPEKEHDVPEKVTEVIVKKNTCIIIEGDTNISELNEVIAQAPKDFIEEENVSISHAEVEKNQDGENVPIIKDVILDNHEEKNSEKVQSNSEKNATSTIASEKNNSEDNTEGWLSQPKSLDSEKQISNEDLMPENIPTSKDDGNKIITEIIPTCNIIEEQVDEDLESSNLIISEVDMEKQEFESSFESGKGHSTFDPNNLNGPNKNKLESDVKAIVVAKSNNDKFKEEKQALNKTAIDTKMDILKIDVEIPIKVHKPDTKQGDGGKDMKLIIDTESSKQLIETSLPLQDNIGVQKPDGKGVVSCDKFSSPECVEENREHISKKDLNPILLTPTKQPQILPPHTTLKFDKKVVEPNANVEEQSTSDKDVAREIFPKSEHIKGEKVVSSVIPVALNITETEVQVKSEQDQKETIKISAATEIKPNNNNHAAVPFGKWTEANRQEFLNKIKEAKVPVNSSHSKQIKNSNDLNRRDVLKKIDSQRQSNIEIQRAKAQEINKLNLKNEIAFSSKTTTSNIASQESKIPVKSDILESKTKPTLIKKVTKLEPQPQPAAPVVTTATIISVTKKEPSKKSHESAQRKELNTAQDLIDQTIEGMLHKSLPPTKSAQEISAAISKAQIKVIPEHLDDIEMKMNELHGIPFIERPPHELPQVIKTDQKHTITEQDKDSKTTKIPIIMPSTNKNEENVSKDAAMDVDSDEEVIEHVPITGDIDLKVRNVSTKYPNKEKVYLKVDRKDSKVNIDTSKKEPIITEKDFDKFARRNSFAYENCLNFDGKGPHNVIQTIKEKDPVENYPYNDKTIDMKAKAPHKSQAVRLNSPSSKKSIVAKNVSLSEEPNNKNYQSKVQMAYQSLTAKRQNTCPITIIEDKPVKVIFMDANSEYIPSQLNVQGKELSPAKKIINEPDLNASTGDSLDSDLMESMYDNKSQDELKTKTKHLRKQVLTPVETPELELIEPSDLGIEVSPKKKRRTDETKTDRSTKNVLPKKSYLLGRSTMTEEKVNKIHETTKPKFEETVLKTEITLPTVPETAFDSLVKAAELLETQSENAILAMTPHVEDRQQNTPTKRGRGRPRKYPIPEGATDKNKIPSPQKKPRLSESKTVKSDNDTDEEVNSDGELIKENWTMGKINENIVCPICNKLFRSENVVFKHVKHCTGVSPNRSDSDNRSPRRFGQSQESDTKSLDSKSDEMDADEVSPITANDKVKTNPKKRKSRDSRKSEPDKDNVIVIEDTPIKEKHEKNDDAKQHETRKITNIKTQTRVSSLVCEFCGKTFRQLSYLVSHKLQHKKEESKKSETEINVSTKSVFSCEVCKKDFRKLHHLVQHRIIHNPSTMPSRQLRKSSSEQFDVKSAKEQDISKPTEDLSAGFRCEPCDKSFRKLHHLVEHRETHDGINRQKNTVVQPTVEKPAPPPQCDVCQKTFRKLHHLIQHREQHIETSSEKSDDKSVKSSLSTKDIIHECSLCYMVFPNEHSLTKHTVICQRKKRQSKQKKPSDTDEPNEEGGTIKLVENTVEGIDELELVTEKPASVQHIEPKNESLKISPVNEIVDVIPIVKEHVIDVKPPEVDSPPLNEQDPVQKEPSPKPMEITAAPSEVITVKHEGEETSKVQDVPKRKTPAKDKIGPTITKRRRTSNLPLSTLSNAKPVDSSDDDEVRYMLNPNFKVDDTSEGKIFMKVRAKKRNSLQIERPNSKDLVTRRISLQHPPKVPRLKPKPVEVKPVATVFTKNIAKITELDPVLSTDSDDSDIKYSFPKTVADKMSKQANEVTTMQELGRKSQRKSIAEKRKSLSMIAKRKSLGKALVVKQKATPPPAKQIKRRTTDVEHRCDCGQLFSSAALLSRHTTLAHTPPRIRRRRSPPPEVESKTMIKSALRKSGGEDKTSNSKISSKQADSRKSSIRSDISSTTKPSVGKSSAKTEAKTPRDTRKSTKLVEHSETKSTTTNVKPKRTPAHRGVPVPEKMKKIMNRMPKKK